MVKKLGGGVAKLGKVAFLGGIVLAVLFGFLPAASWLSWVFVVLGLLVGMLNIEEKEMSSFLMAGTVLALMGFLGTQSFGAVPFLGAIFDNMLALAAPATVVVALKSVWSLAKS